MCTRKNKITYAYSGLSYMKQCEKPAIEGSNLCAYHARKAELKSSQWGNRYDHEPVSEERFLRGGCVKLKTDVGNILWRYRNGKMQKFNKKSQVYEDTDEPVDFTKYCVKKF